VHVPPEQISAGAVQTVAEPPVGVQQGWLAPPQLPQEPAAQVPPTDGQVEPEAVHTLFTQQPPLPQVLLAQQAWPAPPHAVQTPWPAPVQTSLASQARPAQQTWPGPPHAWHTPPTHEPPALQVLPGQHAVPSAPHALMSGMDIDMSPLPVDMSVPPVVLLLLHESTKNRQASSEDFLRYIEHSF
jgi:hypothetical protein